jgi:hypothetical protein
MTKTNKVFLGLGIVVLIGVMINNNSKEVKVPTPVVIDKPVTNVVKTNSYGYSKEEMNSLYDAFTSGCFDDVNATSEGCACLTREVKSLPEDRFIQLINYFTEYNEFNRDGLEIIENCVYLYE